MKEVGARGRVTGQVMEALEGGREGGGLGYIEVCLALKLRWVHW